MKKTSCHHGGRNWKPFWRRDQAAWPLVGPSGEIIMDYSIHDALEAGFDKIISYYKKRSGKRISRRSSEIVSEDRLVEYAYQEMDDLPEGFSVPEGRKKPWGTGQAILAARNLINELFLVINADDYYEKKVSGSSMITW